MKTRQLGLGLVGVGLVLALVLGWWLWPKPVDRAWARVQDTGLIRFATDATYFPFEVIDANGDMFGFDIDLGRALAAQLGVQAHFDQVGYDGLIGALTVYRTDAVLSAFVRDDTRLHEAAYTQAYFNAGNLLVLPAAAEAVPADDALRWASGKTLVAAYGSQGDVLLRNWAQRVVGLTVVVVDDEALALQAVVDGAADGAVVDATLAFPFLQSQPSTLQVSAALDDVPYVLAVHTDSPELLAALSQALATLEADGTLAQLRSEWFGAAAGPLRWSTDP